MLTPKHLFKLIVKAAKANPAKYNIGTIAVG